ncbi:MAG TPA: hypothetical protein VJ901_17315, partial [Thermoanaerobaculia bacterium]|nr:hypothetical protein [Thermoanaerobaculia bacterium]
MKRHGGRDLQHGVREDVALQRAHEKERGGVRIADAHHACFGSAAEVVGDDFQSAPRRIVGLGIERQHERRAVRRRVHGDDDPRREHFLDERHEAFGDVAQHDARIGFRIDVRQLEDAGGRIEQHAALHRQTEQRLLRIDV